MNTDPEHIRAQVDAVLAELPDVDAEDTDVESTAGLSGPADA